MFNRADEPFLPPDLILYIVDFAVPLPNDSKVAYDQKHAITKTLLALTRTSRLIYPVARRLLYTYCLYIDSRERLYSLLDSLSAYSPRLFALRRQPSTPYTWHINATSLYLAPFSESIYSQDAYAVQSTHNLLSLLSPSLRHLVIDIPLRSTYYNPQTRRLLYKGFEKLTSLELFCSARDELFLCGRDDMPPIGEKRNVWSRWPKLKTLALYNVDLESEELWRDLARMDNLQTLVLTRADRVQEVDFRREWARCGNGHKSLTVWFVDVDGDRGIPERMEEPKEGETLTIRAARVPTSYYGDEDMIELCQDWIKRSALRGEAGFQEELRNLST